MEGRKVCPKCGDTSSAGAVVCKNCGERFKREEPKDEAPKYKPCPKCGFLNDLDAEKCISCKKKFPKENSEEEKTAAKKEEKESYGRYSASDYTEYTYKKIKNDRNKADSIESCFNDDPLIHNLRTWSAKLEKWGRVLFFILIILGVVFTIIDTIAASERWNAAWQLSEWEKLQYGIQSPAEVCINSLFWKGLWAFLEYCAYHAVSLLIGAKASDTYNLKVTAKLTEYMARKNEE